MNDSGKKKILLAEDGAIIAMSEKMMLERNGYSVIIARNGDKAVRLAESEEGMDLVLMDIDLGRGMDGTVAAKTILATHDLPVVFLSSHTEPDVVALMHVVADLFAVALCRKLGLKERRTALASAGSQLVSSPL